MYKQYSKNKKLIHNSNEITTNYVIKILSKEIILIKVEINRNHKNV